VPRVARVELDVEDVVAQRVPNGNAVLIEPDGSGSRLMKADTGAHFRRWECELEVPDDVVAESIRDGAHARREPRPAHRRGAVVKRALVVPRHAEETPRAAPDRVRVAAPERDIQMPCRGPVDGSDDPGDEQILDLKIAERILRGEVCRLTRGCRIVREHLTDT